MFFWNSLAFLMIHRMFTIWSQVLDSTRGLMPQHWLERNPERPLTTRMETGPSFALSKTCLNIWKFTVHVLLKPSLENFEHYFTSVWDECNRVAVWALFGIAFLWDWNENWPFPVLWPLLSFPKLLAYWVQHFHSTIFLQYCIVFAFQIFKTLIVYYIWSCESLSCCDEKEVLFIMVHVLLILVASLMGSKHMGFGSFSTWAQ